MRARGAKNQAQARGDAETRHPPSDPAPRVHPHWSFAALDLPLAVPEHRFAPPRRWKFDWAWPRERIALEIEGGAWTRGRHTRGKGFLGDMEKYNRAAIMGWIVVRATPDDVTLGRAAVLVRDVMLAWTPILQGGSS